MRIATTSTVQAGIATAISWQVRITMKIAITGTSLTTVAIALIVHSSTTANSATSALTARNATIADIAKTRVTVTNARSS